MSADVLFLAPQYERVGVTATRDGITVPQMRTLRSALRLLIEFRGAKYFHHGDCVGGDDQAAHIARWLGYTIIGHPPMVGALRAHFPSDEDREPDDYLPRDRALVDEVGLLIGMPNNEFPRPRTRSGTWYTIKYAQGSGTTTAIIRPDGTWAR
jgi:hypothetical protein